MAATINLKVTSDFDQASADLKEFNKNLSEGERQKLQKYFDTYKDKGINTFLERQKKATAAIKATRGPVEAAASEFRALQREMERLIKKGIDPQDDALKPLVARYNQLEKEMKDVGKQQVKNQKNLKVTQGALLAAGAGAALLGKKAVTAFIDFSKASAQAASDAEEIEGKFKVVFGSIAKEAETASSTIADKFDLAASTVNKLLGDTGDILTGLGFDQETALELSENVGTLALDLASFTNFAGGAEGASAALTKALLGEAESAKALGIVIRQDTVEYKDLISSLMETTGVGLVQAKALAALQIATEQSKNAIGDYARTIDSTANVQRRYEESQKSINEAWGVGINEGLTPLRALLADVNNEYADLISNQNRARAFMKDFKDGTVETELSLRELEETLAGLERKRGQTGVGSKLNDEIAAVKTLIEVYGIQDTFLIKAADSARVLAQVETDAAERRAAEIELNLSAEEKLEELRVSSLTAGEKEIENLQTQINYWDSLKTNMEDTTTVQAVIDKLAADRNELQQTEIENNNTLLISTQELFAGRKSIAEEWRESELERIFEVDKAETDANEKAIELAEIKKNALMNIWSELSTALTSFSGLATLGNDNEIQSIDAKIKAAEEAGESTKELEEKKRQILKESWQIEKAFSLTQAAINTAVGVSKALSALPPPFNIALAAITAAAGAAQIAVIAGTSMPAIAEGGSFTTNGPMPVMVGDNIGGREKVTVEPVSSTGLNVDNSGGGSSGGSSGPMVLKIGEKEFDGYMQDKFDDGKFRIPRRILV